MSKTRVIDEDTKTAEGWVIRPRSASNLGAEPRSSAQLQSLKYWTILPSLAA